MADFNNIKDEFKLIAEAQNGIGAFHYDRRQMLNTYRNSVAPIFLLFKQQTTSFPNFERKYKDYQVTFGIYETFPESERIAGTTYDDKQAELENLAEQFLRELRKRSLGLTAESTNTKDWQLEEGVTGTFFEQVGVDGMVGFEVLVTLKVFSDCDEGTFNY
jgi:hypothetical protein